MAIALIAGLASMASALLLDLTLLGMLLSL